MTHNELLAKIEENHWKLFNFYSEDQSDKAIDFRKLLLKNTDALRAVVELHYPDRQNKCIICIIQYYMDDIRNLPYPCPTIQAIEKELK